MNNEAEEVISLVSPKVCELFGEKSMSVEQLLTKLTEISNSIESDEDKIYHLKNEISYEIIANDVILSSIQNKKYQLSLSQNLLKQLQNDIKKLKSQKHSILEGNFEGQITLKMAQTKGFVYLQKDDQHAIEFLASELRFPLINLSKISKQKNSDSSSSQKVEYFDIDNEIEPIMNNYYQFTTSMKTEISNLFNEAIKYFKGMKSIYKEQSILNSTVNEKLLWVKNEIKTKQEERTNLQIELNQLELEINRFYRERKIIKVRPDRFEEQEKGIKIIESKKKEFYRFNRILNEFKNNQIDHHHKKRDDLNKSFNSFDLEMHCFDEDSHFDDDLNKLTRKIRRNTLDLSKELIAHKKDLLIKSEQKENFLNSNISSIQNILNEIQNSNNDLFQKANVPVPDSNSESKNE